jgi:SulP family sulfate permease
MLVVAFVGVITILLAVASLELSYRKEFDLNQALKVHAGTALVSALSGGFLGVISTGRTALNKSSGGGVLSNCIGASLCLLMLLGGGSLLVLIPRAAMGGVILFLGLSMLKTWVWNQYANLTKGEFIEIALILLVVANFGYLVGFSLGVAFACISFVIACSKTPLTSLNSDLSMMTSSVVRHEMQRKILGEQGRRSLIFKLSGYVFFGSANNIEKIFQEAEQQKIQNILLDFSDTVGIDRSAIGVFNRILRRESLSSLRFYFVYGVSNREAVLSMGDQAMNSVSDKVLFFPDLDLAIEAMEESVLDQTVTNRKEIDCFDFIDNLSERELLVSHCELISYQRDAVLCQEGERSDQIFFLKKGELEIVKEISGSSVRLSKMSDGAMVGEMAFYSKEVRTATIRATSASEVYVLNGNSLSELRNRNSELATQFDVFVIKKLSNALSRTNKLVASFY